MDTERERKIKEALNAAKEMLEDEESKEVLMNVVYNAVEKMLDDEDTRKIWEDFKYEKMELINKEDYSKD